MKKINRRKFMKDGALLTGGAICGLTVGAAILAPQEAEGSKIEFVESSCGRENLAGKKILVAYASMHGSTGGIAQAVGQVLCEAGAGVDVRLIKNVQDLSPYQGFVLGSAVRSDAWLPEAKRFVEENRSVLAGFPTAYFLACLTLSKPGPETERKARSFLDPVINDVPEVRPVDLGLFGGVLDFSKFSIGMKAVMKYKMWANEVEEGDYRNWEAIRAWTAGLAGRLV